MSEPRHIPGHYVGEPRPEQPRPFPCVHLPAAGYDDEQVRKSWHARGYATLPEREGHPAGTWCGTCFTDKQGGPS